MSDNINHPAHYTAGEFETIDYIESVGAGYHIGNVIKYISRAGLKDKKTEIEDLEKARWYLLRFIDQTEHEFVTLNEYIKDRNFDFDLAEVLRMLRNLEYHRALQALERAIVIKSLKDDE